MNPATAARASSYFLDPYTTPGTGEGVVVITPRLYKPDGLTPVVLYAHGAGGNAFVGMVPDTAPGLYNFGHRLAEAGYVVVCGDFGGASTWGNPLGVSRIEAARVWATDPAGPIKGKPGKIVMTGSSMGGVQSINYYRTYPANVACCVRTIPVSDLDQMRNYNVANFRDWINSAYGTPLGSTAIYPAQANGPAWSNVVGYVLDNIVTRLGSVYRAKASTINQAPEATPAVWEVIAPGTSFAALPGLGNPATHLADIAALPLLDYYADDDAIISPPTVVTLNNASLTKERHTVTGLGGHSDGSVNGADMDRVIAFCKQYLPTPIGEAA